MEWFRRKPQPPPTERKEIPDGLWTKCNSCGEIIYVRELEKSLWVCRKCSYHFRIRPEDYMAILLDEGQLSGIRRRIGVARSTGFPRLQEVS